MATFLKLLILTVVLLISNYLPPSFLIESFRNVIHRAATPVQFGLFSASSEAKNIIDFFANLKNIRSENIKLKDQVLELKSANTILRELENENKVLNEQFLSFESSQRKKLIKARIIGVPFDDQNSEMVLAVGTKGGVSVGDNVVYKNYVVGSVIDAFENRSVVMLITSPKLSLAVLNQSREGRAKGIVHGRYGISLVMDRILPDEPIQTGDIILTSGQDGVFEEGLLVGHVVSVEDENAQPLKKALLETDIDFTKLEYVFILKKAT